MESWPQAQKDNPGFLWSRRSRTHTCEGGGSSELRQLGGAKSQRGRKKRAGREMSQEWKMSQELLCPRHWRMSEWQGKAWLGRQEERKKVWAEGACIRSCNPVFMQQLPCASYKIYTLEWRERPSLTEILHRETNRDGWPVTHLKQVRGLRI